MSYEARPTVDMLEDMRNLQQLREQAQQVPRKETSDPPKHAAAPIRTDEERAEIVDDVFEQLTSVLLEDIAATKARKQDS